MSTATLNPALTEARQKVREAADYIRQRAGLKPEVAMILGSGLGEMAEEVEERHVIPYKDIPHFPISTAPGHAGNLVLGKLGGKPIVVQQGRFHTYEGYSAAETAFPVRVFHALGAETLVVTAATGGLNRNQKAGDLFLITDHINFTGTNPLIGPNDAEIGARFPVMFNAYTPELRELAERIALQQGVRLQQGVYCGITGPVFFTPAELRMLMTIGADSIGMSTVHEVITAVHAGLRVLGLATITDMAIPDVGHHSSGDEILEIARQTGPKFRHLLKAILAEM